MESPGHELIESRADPSNPESPTRILRSEGPWRLGRSRMSTNSRRLAAPPVELEAATRSVCRRPLSLAMQLLGTAVIGTWSIRCRVELLLDPRPGKALPAT